MNTPTPTLTLDIRYCSPWVLTVWSALKEKGLAFNLKTIDYKTNDHLSKEFLALSPFGKIPVLEHDENVISESLAILEYLEDVFPEKPLYPKDPAAHACGLRARLHAKKADSLRLPGRRWRARVFG